ncbi:putative nuclease HARBI1-like protein [Mycena sanguinolenta]|uniref:Putative nuclease HARBI1-like protein n=1 Tax=Mycena sanguinolenta TaxID=230812 RepID=A0A8H7CPC8_9AGAR|nr:putative nuclease HARBI1-like protein [Mycena sanguinolenta]
MPALRVVRQSNRHSTSSDILRLIQRRRNALYAGVLTTVFCADNFFWLEQSIPIPRHTSILTGQDWLDEIINGHPDRCLDQLGMYPAAFLLLCSEFQRNGGLGDSRHITAEEQTAIFVYWMVHGSSQRDLMERFQRSGDTISKYTNRVLDIATGNFYNKYIQNPADTTPPKIAGSTSYFPFFRYCRGAVNGVHFDSFALAADVVRYRDRHGNVSQNVLAACDFDMRFVYVMPGYEGTAADGRLLDTARRNGFALPEHRYYLADAGFPNCDLLMTPFLGVRYHLNEWDRSGHGTQSFGTPEYDYDVQAKIVAASAALHNFLRIHDRLNSFEVEMDDEEDYDADDHPFLTGAVIPDQRVLAITAAETARANERRRRIAQSMWDNYIMDHDS